MNRLLFALAALATVALPLSAQATDRYDARYRDYPPPPRQVIVSCNSDGYRERYCPVDTRGGVRLVRQVSNNKGPCIEGRSWGYDRRGIWVTNGCRAEFEVGYAGGYRNPYADYWVVRRMDAHAWNEVWLEGRGWVRVDPTAAVAPERVLDTVEDLARAGQLLPEALSPVRDLADWVRRGWNEMVLGFNAARQAQLFRPLGVDQASGLQLVLAFGLGAAAALGLTLWLMLRGRQPPPDPRLRDAARRIERADQGHRRA